MDSSGQAVTVVTVIQTEIDSDSLVDHCSKL